MSEIIDQSKTDNLALDVTPNTNYQVVLRNNPEVIALSDEIKAHDGNSVLAFGQVPAEEISRVSGNLLATMTRTDSEDASKMITQLTKIMSKFDIKELEEATKESAFSKLFNPIAKKLDKMKAKYENLGKEVDEISIILNQHKSGLEVSNKNLQTLYEGIIKQRESLEKYIVAGMIAEDQIAEYEQFISNDPNTSEADKQMKLQQLFMIKDLLGQRLMALRTAENVALQTAPMLQMMMVGNYNLMNKIQTSFIITLPIFKNSLIQAIELKRQAITANSITQLDEKTQELWAKNAQNTATQFKRSIELANSQVLPIEKLRESYDTIQKGIQEAKALNESQIAKRIEDTKQLELLKSDMGQKGLIGTNDSNNLYLN